MVARFWRGGGVEVARWWRGGGVEVALWWHGGDGDVYLVLGSLFGSLFDLLPNKQSILG